MSGRAVRPRPNRRRPPGSGGRGAPSQGACVSPLVDSSVSVRPARCRAQRRACGVVCVGAAPQPTRLTWATAAHTPRLTAGQEQKRHWPVSVRGERFLIRPLVQRSRRSAGGEEGGRLQRALVPGRPCGLSERFPAQRVPGRVAQLQDAQVGQQERPAASRTGRQRRHAGVRAVAAVGRRTPSAVRGRTGLVAAVAEDVDGGVLDGAVPACLTSDEAYATPLATAVEIIEAALRPRPTGAMLRRCFSPDASIVTASPASLWRVPCSSSWV